MQKNGKFTALSMMTQIDGVVGGVLLVLGVIGILTVVSSLSGCAAPVQDFSRVQYVDSTFTAESLRAGGISLLPVLAGEGQEGIRRPLADLLSRYLDEQLGEKYVDHIKSIDRINEGKLAETYASVIDTHEKTGILDRPGIKAIGKFLGTRYLLFVKLLGQDISSDVEYGVLSKGLVRVEQKDVNIFGQVWDTEIGDIVWEGVGQLSVRSSELTYVEQDINELVEMAVVSFLNKLPGIVVVKGEQ